MDRSPSGSTIHGILQARILKQLIGVGPWAGWRWPVGPRPEGGSGSSEHLDVLVEDKVVVFLKGTLEQPQRGFSNAVVQILRLHGIKDYSNQPTILQVYLNSEFVVGGGMHQNEDLVEELKKLGIHSALLDETKDQDSK
ncbi:hypothetical protein K5549_015024 [Capra hircus]|uniref:Glutaredoxin domain-containing protein n=1 Tax=Capra hircus TaxID=9925 RepID=A0A452DKE3_CAPHI|nr:hypothetical protein K5549_015024 [Capra hircus]